MSRHASLLLLASAACVDGFAGPALMRQPPRTPARAHLSAPVMAFGLSFGGRSEEPAGPSEEAQALYRMLGVSEDATYDEIVDGYDALCAKYKGETKKLIKLQVRTDPCAVPRAHRAHTAHTPGTHRARTAHAPRAHVTASRSAPRPSSLFSLLLSSLFSLLSSLFSLLSSLFSP